MRRGVGEWREVRGVEGGVRRGVEGGFDWRGGEFELVREGEWKGCRGRGVGGLSGGVEGRIGSGRGGSWGGGGEVRVCGRVEG